MKPKYNPNPNPSSSDNPNLGPGSYNLNLSGKTSAPSFTFMSRFDEVAKESLKFPGPGAYQQPNQKQIGPLNKGLTEGQKNSIYNSDVVKNPGPGAYDPQVPKKGSAIK